MGLFSFSLPLKDFLISFGFMILAMIVLIAGILVLSVLTSGLNMRVNSSSVLAPVLAILVFVLSIWPTYAGMNYAYETGKIDTAN